MLLALWVLFWDLGVSESDPVLERARQRLLTDAGRMNRFTCRQTVNRVQMGRKERLHSCGDIIRARAKRRFSLPVVSWDRLRLDVAVSKGRELYSWAGAPKFDEGNLRAIAGGGSLGTGDFGPYIASIFGPGAKISFLREQVVNGRKLREYEYEVPLEQSTYAIRTPTGHRIVRVAHKGSFQLDSKQNDLVNLVVRSQELPEEAENCQAISEISYGRVVIGSSNSIVPRETRFRVIQIDGGETLNTTVYSGCREYVGESVVYFEEPLAKVENGGTVRKKEVSIPGGLSFRARITTSIDSERSAAGDVIEAVLLSDLQDGQGVVIAPVGTRLHGRLLQVAGSTSRVQIRAQLDSLDLNGPVPISASGLFRFSEGRIQLKRYDADWLTAVDEQP